MVKVTAGRRGGEGVHVGL